MPASAARHRARHGFEREPYPRRTGDERLERPLRMHQLSSPLRVQPVRSWRKPRRVIAKVEWHPGELYPRVGFIVTNMSRPAERVVAFYNTAEHANLFADILRLIAE